MRNQIMTDDAKRVADLHFNILRNAIYHTARRNFLDGCNRAANFLIIVLGSGALIDAGKIISLDEKWIILAAMVVATAQLVLDFGGSARVHEFLQRRLYELLAELQRGSSAIADIEAKLTTLYGEEPPPMRALDAVAYNAACDALGKTHGRLKVGFLPSLFRNFYPFNETEFKNAAA